LSEGATGVLGDATKVLPMIDVKTLYAKVGVPTLENDLLYGGHDDTGDRYLD